MKSPSYSVKSSAYREAGVDVAMADRLVSSWQRKFKRTARPERIDSPMGFSGLFELPQGYNNPVLVSSTDGVGTKLKLAFELNRHDTIGIDLVAMCVNDVVVSGAEPLVFLDYFATGKIDPNVSSEVMDGIIAGCEMARADLIGGETAEMPGMYADGEYDLAGFCVGVVERDNIIDGSRATDGDVVVGLASSGIHSNGFSLVRQLIADNNLLLTESLDEHTLGEVLLTPTVIYVQPVREAVSTVSIHALAHITGGGLPGNLSRVIPDGLAARVRASSWSRLPVFDWIQATANLSDEEMLETFNCGIGMVAIVSAESETEFRNIVESNGVQTERIGEIVQSAETKILIE